MQHDGDTHKRKFDGGKRKDIYKNMMK